MNLVDVLLEDGPLPGVTTIPILDGGLPPTVEVKRGETTARYRKTKRVIDGMVIYVMDPACEFKWETP